MKIDKLVLWVLIGLACPILLPVITLLEQMNGIAGRQAQNFRHTGEMEDCRIVR